MLVAVNDRRAVKQWKNEGGFVFIFTFLKFHNKKAIWPYQYMMCRFFFFNLLKFDKNHTDTDGDANTDTDTYI